MTKTRISRNTPKPRRSRLAGVSRTGSALAVLAAVAAVGIYGPGVAQSLPGDTAHLATTNQPQTLTTATASPVVPQCPRSPSGDFSVATGVSETGVGAVALWAEQGEQRGLALSPCAAPAAEHWLVGGASVPGETATLVLTNPGVRPASVSLEVFGASGPVRLSSRGLISVAPGAEVSVPIDAIAPEQARLAVHATASGSLVTASLLTTSLNGVSANGLEMVAPTLAPAPHLYFVGLRSDGQTIADPHPPAVRLLSPSTDTTATVHVIGVTGSVSVPGLGEITLRAGVPLDVNLGGLEAGEYAITVTAASPIVGAAVWHRATGTENDLGWLPAATSAPDHSVLLPGGLAANLLIFAPDDAVAPITGTVTGRVEQTFEVNPGTWVLVPVPFGSEPGLVSVAASAPVAIGLPVWAAHDPGLVAGLTPSASSLAPVTAGTVTVQPGFVR